MRLFNLFNNTQGVDVIEQPKQKISLIQEIHNSFNTNIEKLLEEYGVMKSTYDINKELRDKVTKLKDLGFTESKEVKDLEELIKINNSIESSNNNKKQILKDIKYFKEKYPLYKIIDWNSIEFLCNKYQLMYTSVKFFTGNIPEKNLKEMVNFKIEDEDKLFIDIGNNNNELYGYATFNLKIRDKELVHNNGEYQWNVQSNNYNRTKPSLLICAPSKDFNLEYFSNKEAEKYGQLKEIVKEDPIVIQPVYRGSDYSLRKYGIILTAWGDEASDSLVVNESMN